MNRPTVIGLVFLALVSAVAAGCGGDDSDEQGQTTTTTEARTWPGPPKPSRDGTVAVDGFNSYASGVDAPWRRLPLLAAAEFLALREPSAAKTSIVMAAPGGEVGSTVRVTVLLDGLADDSIRTQRYVLQFAREDDGTWRLTSARFAQRCQPGRGHQAFSPALCL